MSEQLAFNQLVRKRSAVDRDELALTAIAVLVDRARDKFLACAGLACNQNRSGYSSRGFYSLS
jgi:hypothetical protein